MTRLGKRTDLNMTEGSIVGCLVRFAFPLLLGNLFQQLYNIVDTLIIGRFGASEEYAAVGSVGPIINILIGFFGGLASGASVVVSQAYGAGDRDKARRTVRCASALTLVLSAAFTLVGILGTPLMLRMMLSDGPFFSRLTTPCTSPVYGPARTYLTVYFAGLSALLIYNMGAGFLRAVGDSDRPFYFLVASALSNIALDLLFVAVLHKGAFGVALATVLAQCLSATLTVLALLRTPDWVRLVPREIGFDKSVLGEILRLGLPAALQMAITAFSNVFVQSYIGGVNLPGMEGVEHTETISLGGWTTYAKVDQFIFLPIQSIALAATTFVGQNIGRGDVARARRGTGVAYLLSTAASVCIIVPVLCFSAPIASLFTRDPRIVEVAATLLRHITAFYLFCSVNQVLAAALRGAGNTRAPMFIMLGAFVGFRQLYLWLMSRFISNDLLPVAYGYPAGWFLCATCMAAYFFLRGELSPLREKRKTAQAGQAESGD